MQKVLEYREQQEEEAKVQMAAAQNRLLEARQREEGLRAEIIAARDQLDRVDMVQQGERWLQEQYLKGLQSDLAASSLQTRMAEQMVEEARKVLAARAMDRKLLEKLRERQKKHYLREESM
ncbi:MAG: flagellar export protein FliJ, partial [Desulfovibrionaceae bacterium]|nr:flagellar export protein FliJ [Desulfovibrionaceae bacterium]